MSLEGSQLGRYQLYQILGSGSMGEVYLAEDSGIRRQVAIKVVRSEPFHYLNEESARLAKQLFEQEMRVIAQLDHPHILPLYDYGDSSINGSTVTYMVMPYRPEGSLLAWLRQQHNHGRQLSLPEVVSLIEQAASALSHAHEQREADSLILRERLSMAPPQYHLPGLYLCLHLRRCIDWLPPGSVKPGSLCLSLRKLPITCLQLLNSMRLVSILHLPRG